MPGLPPVERLEDYLDLVSAVEFVATELETPIVLEGYMPPHDSRVQCIKVTPDPGVIEVNVHPVETWDELSDVTTRLYEAARQCRLGTEKFDLDGKHTGTGGGNHIVLGAATPVDSPAAGINRLPPCTETREPLKPHGQSSISNEMIYNIVDICTQG